MPPTDQQRAPVDREPISGPTNGSTTEQSTPLVACWCWTGGTDRHSYRHALSGSSPFASEVWFFGQGDHPRVNVQIMFAVTSANAVTAASGMGKATGSRVHQRGTALRARAAPTRRGASLSVRAEGECTNDSLARWPPSHAEGSTGRRVRKGRGGGLSRKMENNGLGSSAHEVLARATFSRANYPVSQPRGEEGGHVFRAALGSRACGGRSAARLRKMRGGVRGTTESRRESTGVARPTRLAPRTRRDAWVFPPLHRPRKPLGARLFFRAKT